ncbi:MAG TPA: GAF domain-containing sensor histidine kinase [Streptosporangiaceae bacterium]|nr:GAF domain-containing sensor histidine kinase [Streptosporangiaceae bacterium]
MHAPDTGADVGRAAGGGAGHDPPDQARLRQLAAEQAALRRVATLVARGAPADELFAAVTEEAGQLLAAHLAGMAHYESDNTLTVLATWASEGEHPLVPGPWPLEGGDLASTVFRTGRSVRIDDYRGVSGRIAAFVREELGISSSVASPIVVEGRLWGVLFLHSKQAAQPLPLDAEARLGSFTELVATAIANAQAGQELRELADTQAALRRLATLVARGEPPEAVFAAATREVLRYFGGGTARMIRYEPDGTATLLANEGTMGAHMRSGERWEGYPPAGVTATVRRTGQAARVDDYQDIPGGERYLREELRSAVGVPIHVNGQLWGMIAVGSGQEPMPPDTERRMTQFTDLVATAVANAQNRDLLEASREELAHLLAEQAALRRVATLVARGIDPAEIFSAVAEEIRRQLGADSAGIGRFEPDGTSVVVVSDDAGDVPVNLPIGTRVELRDHLAPAMVWRTGRAAQVDEDAWSSVSDPSADALRELGIRSIVASPVVVEGRLWGVVTALTRRGLFPSGTADRMADFTELVAMAVGNAESRAELAASRARIVAAADQTRRRIERDLHDGTQQRLVSLGLELRLAQSTVPAGLPELDTVIGRVAEELTGVVEDLREIARGIHPAILSEGGLGPALRTLARRAAIAVELDIAAIARLPEPIEVAAYYLVSEALTNATRHAHASVAEVAAQACGGTLRVCVHDDGAGGADPHRGSGLAGLKDRIEALGGTFTLHSPPGGGTTVSCELPVEAGVGQPDTGPAGPSR